MLSCSASSSIGLVADGERALAAEQVDGHALDRADVDEGVAELRVGQQRVRHDVGVPLLAFVQVALLEALRVDRVDLVELQARLGLERREGAHGLRRQRAAVDEEEDAAGDAGLHEPVDLVDHGQRLAGAGRHGERASCACGRGSPARWPCWPRPGTAAGAGSAGRSRDQRSPRRSRG